MHFLSPRYKNSMHTIIIIIFFISPTCEEHTNKVQLQKQDRNIEHIYIIGLVFNILKSVCLYIDIQI